MHENCTEFKGGNTQCPLVKYYSLDLGMKINKKNSTLSNRPGEMYEFYRQSIVGKALLETIDEKVSTNALTPTQAKYILEKFDLSIPTVFSKSVTNSMSFKGNISSYNYVDGVWKFLTKDFVMSLNNEYFRSDFVKIVACDADTNVDAGRRRRKKG